MPSVPLLEPTSYAFNFLALPPMVVSTAMIHIGFVTLRREGVSRVSLAFLFVIFVLATWLVGVGMSFLCQRPDVALWWTRFAFVGVCAIPAACLQFALVFLRQTRRHRVLLAGLWIATLLFELMVLTPGSGFFAGMHRYWWGYYSLFGPSAKWLIVAILAAVLASLFLYVQEYRSHPPDSLHRLRALSFTKAFGVAYLASVDFLANYGIEIYPIGYLAILVFIIISNRTIRLYKLQDITPSYAADSIISTMQDALLVLDDEGIIRVANGAAGRLFDTKPETLVGQPVRRYLSPPPAPQTANHAVHRDEVTVETPSGRRCLQLSVTEARPQPAQPPATIILLHDITDRKKAEEKLQEAHDLLERRVEERTRELEIAHRQLRQTEKLRAIGMLTASIAHEIGGPIFAIRNILEGLRDAPDLADEQRRLLAMGINECERVGKLLQNMRDLHAPDTAKRERVDLNRLVDDVLILCREQCDKEHIVVERHLAPGPLAVEAAADQIKQVLINLIANARDAMPDGGMLVIRTERHDGTARLVVTDTGRGIAPEHLGRLFEPFFTTKEEQFGTGLGLYISYNIVKRHGGTMEVVSTPGQGTTFTISLPAA